MNYAFIAIQYIIIDHFLTFVIYHETILYSETSLLSVMPAPSASQVLIPLSIVISSIIILAIIVASLCALRIYRRRNAAAKDAAEEKQIKFVKQVDDIIDDLHNTTLNLHDFAKKPPPQPTKSSPDIDNGNIPNTQPDPDPDPNQKEKPKPSHQTNPIPLSFVSPKKPVIPPKKPVIPPQKPIPILDMKDIDIDLLTQSSSRRTMKHEYNTIQPSEAARRESIRPLRTEKSDSTEHCSSQNNRPSDNTPPNNGIPPKGPIPAGAPPKGPIPAGAPPKGPIPAGTPPKGPIPAGAPPKGPIPAGAPPKGPIPAGAPLKGPIPAGTPPKGSIPAGAPPKGPILAGAPPKGPIPAGTPPKGPIPAGAPPKGPIPAGTPPKGSIPAGAPPKGPILAGAPPKDPIPAGASYKNPDHANPNSKYYKGNTAQELHDPRVKNNPLTTTDNINSYAHHSKKIVSDHFAINDYSSPDKIKKMVVVSDTIGTKYFIPPSQTLLSHKKKSYASTAPRIEEITLTDLVVTRTCCKSHAEHTPQYEKSDYKIRIPHEFKGYKTIVDYLEKENFLLISADDNSTENIKKITKKLEPLVNGHENEIVLKYEKSAGIPNSIIEQKPVIICKLSPQHTPESPVFDIYIQYKAESYNQFLDKYHNTISTTLRNNKMEESVIRDYQQLLHPDM